MQIEIPIFDDTGNIVDYNPMSIEFPYCVKKSNFFFQQFKMIDEEYCYEITLFNDGPVQLHKVRHDEANESVNQYSYLLGLRFWRFGFQKQDYQPCQLSEFIKVFNDSFLFFEPLLDKYVI